MLQFIDTTPPVLTCPNIREPAPGNDFQKAVEFADAGCTDDSGSYTFTCNRETGSMFSIWETESVSCSCTDGSDNTADCTFTVEVFGKVVNVLNGFIIHDTTFERNFSQ